MAKAARLPKYVTDRAAILVEQIKAGTIKPRRAKHIESVRVVDIGRRYRLLSTDHGETWRPVSHEAYNREVSECYRSS